MFNTNASQISAFGGGQKLYSGDFVIVIKNVVGRNVEAATIVDVPHSDSVIQMNGDETVFTIILLRVKVFILFLIFFSYRNKLQRTRQNRHAGHFPHTLVQARSEKHFGVHGFAIV